MTIRDFYTTVLHVPEQRFLEDILLETTVQTVAKGEILIREGEKPAYLFFLMQGILRGYFFDSDGREITDCFAFQCGAPVMPSISLDKTSYVNIEVLEESKLLRLPMEFTQRMLKQHPELWQVYQKLSDDSLECHREKLVMYQSSAMERYQWFLRKYPGMDTKIKGKHIASFLNITPVTLSRLRKQLIPGDRNEIISE